MSHAQVTCLEPLQMRPAHGSCQRKHRQNKRLQYLVHPAQDKGGQDPQRLFHRSKRDRRWKKAVRQRYMRCTCYGGFSRPVGQQVVAVDIIWCSYRNNIPGTTGSQRVCSFVCRRVVTVPDKGHQTETRAYACAPHRTARHGTAPHRALQRTK